MLHIPDNYSQWARHDAEQQEWLNKLPKCSECDEPIQDEHCFVINDEVICESCMNGNYRKCTEDLVR